MTLSKYLAIDNPFANSCKALESVVPPYFLRAGFTARAVFLSVGRLINWAKLVRSEGAISGLLLQKWYDLAG